MLPVIALFCEMGTVGERVNTRRFMVERNEHQRIIAAGWAYRTNERGWIVYRNLHSGIWYTKSEAISIIRAEEGDSTEASVIRTQVLKSSL